MAATPDRTTRPGPSRTAGHDSAGTSAMGGGVAVQEPALTVAAVARRLGVAPATLRTWDRRYGLGPSEHVAGAHRRYTRDDLARLAAMRRLTLEGVPPAEAARLVVGAVEGTAADAPVEPLPDREGRLVATGRPTGGGPGGRVLPLPGADAAVRGLGRAAMALDARAVTAAVRE